MDRLEAMAMLIAAVDAGSLSAAARTLRVPVPTLTRKVTDLETQLNTQLLMRTTRKLTLTDAGVAYVENARRILKLVDEQEREATGEFTTPRGELVVTAPVALGRRYVIPVIADFLAEFPDIRVKLIQADQNLDLVESQIDLAVRVGKLPDSSMIATQVGSMRTVVCASPRYFATHGVPQTPDDLTRMPCVTFSGPMLSPNWRFHLPGSDVSTTIAVPSRLETTSPEAAAQGAIDGVGLTRLLHYHIVDALDAGTLRLPLEAFEIERVPVHLVHASRSQMALKLRRFLDFAIPRFRKDLERFGK